MGILHGRCHIRCPALFFGFIFNRLHLRFSYLGNKDEKPLSLCLSKTNPRKVTDGGSIFYSTVALQFYDMLGIRKERIDPGEPWQDYAETLLYVTWNYPSW